MILKLLENTLCPYGVLSNRIILFMKILRNSVAFCLFKLDLASKETFAERKHEGIDKSSFGSEVTTCYSQAGVSTSASTRPNDVPMPLCVLKTYKQE